MQKTSGIISALSGGIKRSDFHESTGNGQPRQLYCGTKRSLVRLYQNVEACKIAKDAEDKEGLDGFQYDEYCVEVESWPGLAASVRENYDTYLAKGKDNEVDRSNDALFRAQKNTDSIVQDTDAMSVDHEYRLTLLELGLSE